MSGLTVTLLILILAISTVYSQLDCNDIEICYRNQQDPNLECIDKCAMLCSRCDGINPGVCIDFDDLAGSAFESECPVNTDKFPCTQCDSAHVGLECWKEDTVGELTIADVCPELFSCADCTDNTVDEVCWFEDTTGGLQQDVCRPVDKVSCYGFCNPETVGQVCWEKDNTGELTIEKHCEVLFCSQCNDATVDKVCWKQGPTGFTQNFCEEPRFPCSDCSATTGGAFCWNAEGVQESCPNTGLWCVDCKEEFAGRPCKTQNAAGEVFEEHCPAIECQRCDMHSSGQNCIVVTDNGNVVTETCPHVIHCDECTVDHAAETICFFQDPAINVAVQSSCGSPCSHERVTECMLDPNCQDACPDFCAEVCYVAGFNGPCVNREGNDQFSIGVCDSGCPLNSAHFVDSDGNCKLPDYGCFNEADEFCFCKSDNSLFCESPVDPVLDTCEQCPTDDSDVKCRQGELVCDCRDNSCFTYGDDQCTQEIKLLMKNYLEQFETPVDYVIGEYIATEIPCERGNEFDLNIFRECNDVFNGLNCYCVGEENSAGVIERAHWYCEWERDTASEGNRPCTFNTWNENNHWECKASEFKDCWAGEMQCTCETFREQEYNADGTVNVIPYGEIKCQSTEEDTIPECPIFLGETCGEEITLDNGNMAIEIANEVCRRSDSQLCKCEQEYEWRTQEMTLESCENFATDYNYQPAAGTCEYTRDENKEPRIFNGKRFDFLCLDGTTGADAQVCGCTVDGHSICQPRVEVTTQVAVGLPQWRCPEIHVPTNRCPTDVASQSQRCEEIGQSCVSDDGTKCYCKYERDDTATDPATAVVHGNWVCPVDTPDVPPCADRCCSSYDVDSNAERENLCGDDSGNDDNDDRDYGIDHKVRLQISYTLRAGESLPAGVSDEIVNYAVLRNAEVLFSSTELADGRKKVTITIFIDESTIRDIFGTPEDDNSETADEDRADRAKEEFERTTRASLESRGITIDETESNVYIVDESANTDTSNAFVFVASMAVLAVALF